MDVTFMTINDLSDEATIVFSSDSVQDILGFRPDEIRGKSAFDFFHPGEVSKARKVHNRGVLLDKAAVLHTVHIRSKAGNYEKCECTFTIVQNVLIACIGLYKPSYKSHRRANDAPRIRQLFKCSTMDPMYHMLEQLSPKYQMPPMIREPRAVLILNRFTRTLSIMFASDSVLHIMGIPSSEISNRSFYELIQESCLAEVIACLESAKANDSIAYLRFWYRDLRIAENREDEDDDDTDESDEDDPSDTGRLSRANTNGSDLPPIKAESPPPMKRFCMDPEPRRPAASYPPPTSIDTSSAIPEVLDAMEAEGDRFCDGQRHGQGNNNNASDIEIEAVVSCTSDGIAVVVRRARPPIPVSHPPMVSTESESTFVSEGARYDERVSTPSYSTPDHVYGSRPPL